MLVGILTSKLRILMKLSSLTENEESAAFSSNIATPQVTPEVSEQQPKLRRFSSTGSTSQEGTESMLKRLGKKCMFSLKFLNFFNNSF